MQETRSFMPFRAAASGVLINTAYRGGGWCVDPQEARLTHCSISDQAGRGPYLSFRLGLDIIPEGDEHAKEG